MSDDLKPEDMVVVIRRCVAEVVDIFAQHAPDAPPVDLRLRRELSGAIERATDEAFITGVLSPERISADVAEIINKLDDICSEDLDDDTLRDVWAMHYALGVGPNPVYKTLADLGVPPRGRRVDIMVGADGLGAGRMGWLRAGWPTEWAKLVDRLPRIAAYA